MKKVRYATGKLVNKYKLVLKDINDLNKKYEKAKNHLSSYGPHLAGRLASELQFTTLIESTSAFKKIVLCMQDYLTDLSKLHLLYPGHKDLDIISCWINDMVRGEYNPPHTHHNMTGWSTVLFLKVPKFINDAKDPHKFHDGQLGFTGVHGNVTEWMTPKVGDFYIFQASHQHFVMPFKTKTPKEIRRSMSFNFIIKEKSNVQ
tara:strand:+ start:384 stop:992 length:609 start_codon:yes stop_codon:yes gene_type:complete